MVIVGAARPPRAVTVTLLRAESVVTVVYPGRAALTLTK